MFSSQKARHQSTRQAVHLSPISQCKARHPGAFLEDNRGETVQRVANKTGLPEWLSMTTLY